MSIFGHEGADKGNDRHNSKQPALTGLHRALVIKRIRIDYDKPSAPGLFVIRCNAKGKIEAENSNLAYRQQRNGAGVTVKVVKVVAKGEQAHFAG